MQDLKISLITVTYNAQNTLKRCIESVVAQNYPNVEYIIIDGYSTDNTVPIIEKYKNYISVFVSEPDKGIYDAMNKGIKFAKGDIVGILNADDYFAADDILSSVAEAFERSNAEVLYGDLEYVSLNQTPVRKWCSGAYNDGMFNWGWMPPHPTFYCKRSLFETLGFYDLQYGTAADYELMLRFIHVNKLITYYLNRIMVKMSIGGISNQSYLNRIDAWKHDYKAMGNNGVYFPLLCVIFKPLRKLRQYL